MLISPVEYLFNSIANQLIVNHLEKKVKMDVVEPDKVGQKFKSALEKQGMLKDIKDADYIIRFAEKLQPEQSQGTDDGNGEGTENRDNDDSQEDSEKESNDEVKSQDSQENAGGDSGKNAEADSGENTDSDSGKNAEADSDDNEDSGEDDSGDGDSDDEKKDDKEQVNEGEKDRYCSWCGSKMEKIEGKTDVMHCPKCNKDYDLPEDELDESVKIQDLTKTMLLTPKGSKGGSPKKKQPKKESEQKDSAKKSARKQKDGCCGKKECKGKECQEKKECGKVDEAETMVSGDELKVRVQKAVSKVFDIDKDKVEMTDVPDCIDGYNVFYCKLSFKEHEGQDEEQK